MVLASCYSDADMALGEDLAANSRNAALACVHYDVGAELAGLISRYAPDRVIVVGGESAVWPETYDGIKETVKEAYRWAVVERAAGRNRAWTSIESVRLSLGSAESVGTDEAILVMADGWDENSVDIAVAFAKQHKGAAVVMYDRNGGYYGFLDDVGSLIYYYQPKRVVFAGAGDETIEAAARAALDDMGSDTYVERVIWAGESAVTQRSEERDGYAELIGSASQRFWSIVNGLDEKDDSTSGELPFVALSEAQTTPGSGSSLHVLRADGSARERLTERHMGWRWNAADGRLAWVSRDGSAGLGSPGGSWAELRTDGQGWPLWSPDGDLMVTFSLSDSDGDGLADGAEASLRDRHGNLTRDIGDVGLRTWYYAGVPGTFWAPDGSRFMYVSVIDEEGAEDPVPMLTMGRTDGKRGPFELARDGVMIQWAPDGEHFLYGTPWECNGEEQGMWLLWMGNENGTNLSLIGPAYFDAWDVVRVSPWSPDGGHFAYVSVDRSDCSVSLSVNSTERGSDPLVIGDADELLGWGPEGTYLQYAAQTGIADTDFLPVEQSWLMTADGSGKRLLGNLSPSAHGWAQWSSDGEWVAYTEEVGSDSGPALRGVVERYDGSGKAVIAERGNVISWSEDGTELAYVEENPDGSESLKLYRARTKESTVLVPVLADTTRVAIWSPAGDQLMYASGPTESLLEWLIGRGRGVSLWSVSTHEPAWSYRLIENVTWGEWQTSSGSAAS